MKVGPPKRTLTPDAVNEHTHRPAKGPPMPFGASAPQLKAWINAVQARALSRTFRRGPPAAVGHSGQAADRSTIAAAVTFLARMPSTITSSTCSKGPFQLLNALRICRCWWPMGTRLN